MGEGGCTRGDADDTGSMMRGEITDIARDVTPAARLAAGITPPCEEGAVEAANASCDDLAAPPSSPPLNEPRTPTII